ncbi:MAG TPA: aminotransferase [Actinobacteria bacterium]|jgi:selenocysteine lyase/cysteine desulfurase|nr:aminotransferase [Actinomycetota bacterium]
MTIDVAACRADTPACEGQAFLDNAGSALSPTAVTRTVIDYLKREQEVGGYAAMDEAQDRILAVNASAGELVGVPVDQVALQTSATAAWRRAFGSIPLRAGDRILTTRAEYASNVLPMLQASRRVGAIVEFIPDGPDGTVDPAALGAMLDERVRVVAITHAASQNGLIVDAAGIGAVLRESGSPAWYLLDACQSLGQLPVDMTAIGADFIAATGRKFLRGPRGTGFLAVSPRVLAELEPVPIDMFGAAWDGDQSYELSATASRYQSFETSYAAVLGLGAAIDYSLALGLHNIRERINGLATSLRAQLSELPGVRVLDRGAEQSGIVVFSCPGDDSWDAARELRAKAVTVTAVTRPTNPPDVDRYGASCVLRASPHVFNTDEDLAALVAAL